MGFNRRAVERDHQDSIRDRFASTIAICASIIAAVRLAREDIARPSPRVLGTIADSVGLAKQILDRVLRQR